jgi:hypothetical protein
LAGGEFCMYNPNQEIGVPRNAIAGGSARPRV